MHISRSIYLNWGSTGISLHVLQFKKCFDLILALYAARVSACLKQTVLAPVSLLQLQNRDKCHNQSAHFGFLTMFSNSI